VPIRKSSVVVVLLMLFTFAGMSAATTYTAANVKGSYSLLANAYGGAPEQAYVGMLTFDGVNTVTGSFTGINNGSLDVGTITSGSTYTVSANGKGSLTANVTSTLFGSETVQIVFTLNSVTASVAHSLQFVWIDTPGIHVFLGTANLVGLTVPATAARLKGTYSVSLGWWTTGTQQGDVGTLVFDGKSKVTSALTIEVAAGTATSVTGTGTYSVNSDGSGSMSLTLSNGTTMDFDLVMNSITGTSVAKGIQLLEVDNPISTTVVTGNAVFE
jgi:hypothetical protein